MAGSNRGARGADPDSAARRERLVQEIERIEGQLSQLAREINEQGGLREPAEQGQYFAERARLEERLSALRRELTHGASEGLPDEKRGALGRRVTIRLVDGAVETWTLAAPGDANPRESRISVESPLGRALAGASPGQVVEVETPEESYSAEVLKVA